MEERARFASLFFVFRCPEAACGLLVLPEGKVAFVAHKPGDGNAYTDLWLMSRCNTLLPPTARSVGGGIVGVGRARNGVAVTADIQILKLDGLAALGSNGSIPDEWMQV